LELGLWLAGAFLAALVSATCAILHGLKAAEMRLRASTVEADQQTAND
jgi:hypothetical protein